MNMITLHKTFKVKKHVNYTLYALINIITSTAGSH